MPPEDAASEPSVAPIGRRGYALVAMARPAFLLGTVPLYLVGVAAAARTGTEVDVATALLGLAVVWSVQAMTHYANEYWDLEVDRAVDAPTRVTGGSRVLVRGLVPRRTARRDAAGSLAVALVLGTVTALRSPNPAAVALVVAAAVPVGWFYSTPPVRLVARGVGEVTVGLVTGALVPALGSLLQAGTVDAVLGRAVLFLAPLAFATSVSTALPDRDADRVGGKRTLAVRLGRANALALDAVALLVGVGLFTRFARSIDPALGSVAVAGCLLPLALFGTAVRGTVDGSTDAAERVALAGIATLGWVGVSTVGLLVLA